MASPSMTAGALRRDTSRRILGGVSSGIARHFGVDPVLLRIAFVALTFAGGAGPVVYVLLWAFVPADGSPGAALPMPRLRGRGGIEVGLGAGLLLLSLLLTFRALGVWWSDVVVWPVVLIAAGAALLWREAGSPRLGSGGAAAPPAGDETGPEDVEEPVVAASRTGLGVALVVAAGVVFLGSTGALSGARDVLLSVFVVAVVLAVIFGPWIVRLARSLTVERAERIRSEERAEISAHLHDSVLQTLALVQQRSGDAKAVEALARRQERELRAWLGRRAAPGASATLASALEDAAADVERDHGARVEVVMVGEAELDERAQALVAAAREAMVNAAKFGGGTPVDVFAEVGDGGVQVFIRDRGPGFDPDAIGEDRRGVRDSIIGRMARHGGTASVHSEPGAGTEVELTLPAGKP